MAFHSDKRGCAAGRERSERRRGGAAVEKCGVSFEPAGNPHTAVEAARVLDEWRADFTGYTAKDGTLRAKCSLRATAFPHREAGGGEEDEERDSFNTSLTLSVSFPVLF